MPLGGARPTSPNTPPSPSRGHPPPGPRRLEWGPWAPHISLYICIIIGILTEPYPRPHYHCVIVCVSSPALRSNPLFISLSLGFTLCLRAPFIVPVYKPCPLCPLLVCETCLNKAFGVRCPAEPWGRGAGVMGGGGRGRGPELGLGVGGRTGRKWGAQDRISLCPSFLSLHSPSPGATAAWGQQRLR